MDRVHKEGRTEENRGGGEGVREGETRRDGDGGWECFFIGWPLIRRCNMMSSSESSCIYTVPPCEHGPQHSRKCTVG